MTYVVEGKKYRTIKMPKKSSKFPILALSRNDVAEQFATSRAFGAFLKKLSN